MTEIIEVTQEIAPTAETNAMVDAARKVLLASLGAIVLAQEELGNFMGDTENFINKLVEDAEAFINKLVERGALAEKDGRQLISEMLEKRTHRSRETAHELVQRAESGLDKGMVDVLNRMNIPTKNDIEALTKKINTLSRKVDKLKKTQAEAEKVPA